MTTDDLRTRAREAAEKRVRRSGYPLDGPIANLMHIPAAIDSFTEGALWHAAQQPSREEIERAVGEVVAIASNHPVPHVVLGQNIELMRTKITDAVLALFDGADRRRER